MPINLGLGGEGDIQSAIDSMERLTDPILKRANAGRYAALTQMLQRTQQSGPPTDASGYPVKAPSFAEYASKYGVPKYGEDIQRNVPNWNDYDQESRDKFEQEMNSYNHGQTDARHRKASMLDMVRAKIAEFAKRGESPNLGGPVIGGMMADPSAWRGGSGQEE